MKAKMHAHRAARASSGGSSGASSGGSSGGSYGAYRSYRAYGSSGGGASYGSSGASYYRGGSSGGHVSYSAPSYGSSGGGSVSVHYAAPQVHVEAAPIHVESPIHSSPSYYEPPAVESHGESIIESHTHGASTHSVKKTEAMLTMRVPAESNVFVNGTKTRSTGAQRQFVSRGLKPGYSYSYKVRIETTVSGRPVVETKTVRLQGGQSQTLVYKTTETETRVASQPKTVETVLKVNVPANAKVTLAGNPTSADGSSRVFRTKQLKPGQAWNNYVVSVSIDRDGRTVTKQKSITLRAGSQPELTFDFAEESLAMR